MPVPDIPQLKNRKPGAEYALRVSYKLKKDTDWAKKGYELAFDQLQLPVQGGLPMFTAPAGKVTLGADKHTVSGARISPCSLTRLPGNSASSP